MFGCLPRLGSDMPGMEVVRERRSQRDMRVRPGSSRKVLGWVCELRRICPAAVNKWILRPTSYCGGGGKEQDLRSRGKLDR